jgi:ribosome-associated protein
LTPSGGARPLKPKGLAKKVAELALSKKAEDVMILDMTGLSAACDYFVIASGGSEQQVLAISDHIDEKMRERGLPPWHVEGRSHRRWILLDFVDVVVHIFHQETRQYYMLEKLWGDAKVTRLEEDTEPRRSGA